MKFTKTLVPVLLVLAVAVGSLIPTSAQASRDDLLKVAVDRLVSGWTVVPDSTTYGQGSGLWDIYNGGYEVYTDAGVIDALRRLYTRSDEYIEVTVHTMKSSQSARAFLANRYKMETNKDAPRTANWNRFTVSGAGSTTAYAVQGHYYMTVVAYHGGDKGKQQTAQFLKPLEENAVKRLPRQK